ncbi:MAG: glycerophosphodiester phosphodiesterase [Chloroflexi bacterium]|nr:glycerophosphodiester phosphodiesterase [Chloroflexota bacterium]
MKPLIIGHRGASAVAPENTLAAFKRAFELGADGIELDVTLTKDGVPVVIHDEKVDRTTNGHGLVKQMTLDQIKQFDAGAWFDEKYRGEKIPTLAETLGAIGARGLVNIELKTEALRPWPAKPQGVPRLQIAKFWVMVLLRLRESSALEEKVVEVIEQTRAEKNVVLSCFNPFALGKTKSLNARLQRGLLYSTTLPIYLKRAWFLRVAQPHALHPNAGMVTPEYAARMIARGYKINVWTVDDPIEAKRLAGLGVNAIITNKPDVVR